MNSFKPSNLTGLLPDGTVVGQVEMMFPPDFWKGWKCTVIRQLQGFAGIAEKQEEVTFFISRSKGEQILREAGAVLIKESAD